MTNHHHCANGCEKAVAVQSGERLVCARCGGDWVPCGPEICDLEEPMPTNHTEAVSVDEVARSVEAVADAMMSYLFAEAQPDRGDVFSWLDDRRHALAQVALSAISTPEQFSAEAQRHLCATAIRSLKAGQSISQLPTDLVTDDNYTRVNEE